MGNRRTGLVDTKAKQLPLPFYRFLIDENLPGRRFIDTLGESRTDTTASLDLLEAPDAAVSRSAAAQGSWVVTRDKTFYYDSVKAGVVPPGVVVVPEAVTASDFDVKRIASTIAEACDELPLYRESEILLYLDVTTNRVRVREVPVPPIELRKILPELDVRGRIKTLDLANTWGCTRHAARRKARKLVTDDWLGVLRKGRSNIYFRGQRLGEFRNLSMTLRHPSLVASFGGLIHTASGNGGATALSG